MAFQERNYAPQPATAELEETSPVTTMQSGPVNELINDEQHDAFQQAGTAEVSDYSFKGKDKKPKNPKPDNSTIKQRSTLAEALAAIDEFEKDPYMPDESVDFPGAKKKDIAATLRRNIQGEMNTCNQGDSNLCGMITPTRSFIMELDPKGYVKMVTDLYLWGETTYTYTNKRGKERTKTLKPTQSVKDAAAQLNQEPGDKKEMAGAKPEVLIAPKDGQTAQNRTRDEKGNLTMLKDQPLKPNEQMIIHSSYYDSKNPDNPYLRDADAMFNISMLQKYGVWYFRGIAYPLNNKGKTGYKPGAENTKWGGTDIRTEKKMLQDFYGVEPFKEYGGFRRKKITLEEFTETKNYAGQGHVVMMLVNSDFLRNETGKVVSASDVKKKDYNNELKQQLEDIEKQKTDTDSKKQQKQDLLENTQLVEPAKETAPGLGTHWIQFIVENGKLYYWEYSSKTEIKNEANFLESAAAALIMPKIDQK